jgi:hypothetical protein
VCVTSVFCVCVLVVLGAELGALHLLGRYSTTKPCHQLFLHSLFFYIGSLYVWDDRHTLAYPAID